MWSAIEVKSLLICVILVTCLGQAIDNDWTLVANSYSLPTIDGKLDFEKMSSVGNGHIATIVYSDTIYMNGLYYDHGVSYHVSGVSSYSNPYILANSHRARIPSQHDIRLEVNDTIQSHTYALDMWKGLFEETITTESSIIKHRTYTHQHYTQLIVTDIEVSRRSTAKSRFLNLDLKRSRINSTKDIVVDELVEHTDVERCSEMCMKAQGSMTGSNSTGINKLYLFWTEIPDKLTLTADSEIHRWIFVTSMDTDEHKAKTVFQSAMFRIFEGANELYKKHLEAWEDKWNKGRIDMEGNTRINRVIHSSLYYLLSSLPATMPNQPNGQFFGLSSRGLAHDSKGRVNSDMERWIYPPILMFYPEIAKAMLSYRVYGMDSAYESASRIGYEGLRYPATSTLSGEELSGKNQEYVTAVVAFAAREYISATRDSEWLQKDDGYRLLRDIGKFWVSKVSFNDTKNAYEIKDVTGPDEFAQNISNSVFTNVAAKLAIQFAKYSACLTDLDKIAEIHEDWIVKAHKMFIPFMPTNLLHAEYEGYDSSEVQQADTILLGYPLLYKMNETLRRNDLSFYENLTSNEASQMTWAIFAINWLEIGEDEKAAAYFERSFTNSPTVPFEVWSDAVGSGATSNYLPGMGGFLQAVIFGYGGARLHVEHLEFNPKLPPDVMSLRFVGLDYLGTSFDLYIKSEEMVIVVQDTGNLRIHLKLKATWTKIELTKGREIRLPRSAFILYTTNITDCPLPEDSSCPSDVSDDGKMSSLYSNITPTAPVKHIIVKQTGSESCSDYWTCTAREKSIQSMDSSYNFLIGEDGRIYINSGWNIYTHSILNQSVINIGLIGDFVCNRPNDHALSSLQHLLKCGISQGIIDQRYNLISGRQLLLKKEIIGNHDLLHCSIKESRHWSKYQYGGDYIEPKCSGRCFQPYKKPDSLYTDISEQPTVFETERLPMKDGEIDFRYMASVGNGHLATVVYSPTVYINGLFNGPTGWSHRARIPSKNAIYISVMNSSVKTRRYQLDVQRAVFEEKIETQEAVIRQRTYAHQYYNRLLITEIQIDRKGEPGDGIIINLVNKPGNASDDIDFAEAANITDIYPSWPSGDYWFEEGITYETESNSTERQRVYLYWTHLEPYISLPSTEESRTWVFFTSIDKHKDFARDSFEKALHLQKADVHSLYNSHVDAWRKRWSEGSIVLEGDNYLSKRIYGSFYYLLSFLPSTEPFIRNNQFYGLSPGGLANGANWTDYQGHVFWDMETWMYPPMLMFHPDLAKEMISYRIYAMDPAYERAEITDPPSQGLRYPWESAKTGVEQTPDICVPCRENQQHITGDIALAARQYLAVTRDMKWLKREKGHIFIRDMAKFWATRPVYNDRRDSYDVNGVMPPDEHAQSINNSVYTNVGAKLSIYFARYAACLAGMNVSEEVPQHWLEVADKLFLSFNEEKKFHPEFEGYETWTDERGVKQADAILLGYPQMWPMDKDVRRNDLIHYEKVTNPLGPAMTWGMFSIGWLELDDEQKAHELFHRSYLPYVREPFKIWTEARSGIGAVNFITGMGGFLQAIINGYGGVRIFIEHMEFDPRLPAGNTALKFLGMNYLKNSLDIEIYQEKVIVVLRKESKENPLFIQTQNTGQDVILTEGKEVIIVRQPFSLRSHQLTDCPLPKDEVNRGDNCPNIVSESTWRKSTTWTNINQQPKPHAIKVNVEHTGLGWCRDFLTCVKLLHETKINSKLVGDLYNFIIGGDGRIYEGKGWDGISPGQEEEEEMATTIDIGILGDYKCKNISEKQLYRLKRLIKCGIELKKIHQRFTVNVHKSLPRIYNQIMEWRKQPVMKFNPACDETISKLQGDIQDISEKPTVFRAKSLPMNDGKIDFRYMASVGNGHLATTIFSPTVYVNGIYNGELGYSHRARVPSLNALDISIEGDSDEMRSYSLDVETAVFTETIKTSDISIEHRIYAHQYYVRLLVTEVLVTRQRDQAENIVLRLKNRVPNFESEDITFDEAKPLNRKDLCGKWPCWRCQGRTNIPESENAARPFIHVLWYELPSNLTLHASKLTDRWIFLTSIDQTIDRASMNFEAGRRDFLADQNLVYEKHVKAWKEKWSNGRIDLEGNVQLSKLVYGSFYYILSSLPSSDTYLPQNQFYGLSPGGLANGANATDYQGHVFWDMETWMYPGILMFHPELAKAMLSYRIYSMKPAYERAVSNGREGLQFPWEAAYTGGEVTPDICIPCRENQQHITGDIAFAAKQYLAATRDLKWLKNDFGFEFIRDMGKFWLSRAQEDVDSLTALFNINGVMPPDEYQRSINNSVYTNIGAVLAIRLADYAACLAEKPINDIEHWLNVSKRIKIPLNSDDHFHPEFEGFEHVTGERRIIKQADAILTGFPQMWAMTDKVRRNDLEMYGKITTTGGPAMTWGMFSIGWLELGDEMKAKDYFHKSYSPYVREPFKIWTEAQSGIGAVNFITGMGGFLQTVLFGYGGLRLHIEKLEFNPKIVPGTSGMRFVGLDYLGNSLNFDINEEMVKVVLTHMSGNTLELQSSDSKLRFILLKDREYKLKRQAFTIRTLEVTECPLLEGSSCPDIIPRSGWEDAEVWTNIVNTVDNVSQVIIHQVEDQDCSNYKDCTNHIKAMKKNSGEIPYNFIIDQIGNVYEGSGWQNTNHDTFVIGFFGDYTCRKLSKSSESSAKYLLKCGVERGMISKTYTVITNQQEKNNCMTDICRGEYLLCVVKTWKHWTAIGVHRQPRCDGTCIPPKEPDRNKNSIYHDISPEPHIFQTRKLPMKNDKDDEIDFRYMASIGNGHIATLLYSDTIYMNGLYNGPTGWSHRARIPATQAIFLHHDNSENRLYSLDVKRGIFEETFTVETVKVIHRNYAHQYYTRLLVTEIILTRPNSDTTTVSIDVRTNQGGPSDDITFSNPDKYINANYRYKFGETKVAELLDNKTQQVHVYHTIIDTHLVLNAGESTKSYIYITSIDFENWAAKNTFDEALRIIDVHPSNLYNRHVEEWRKKWTAGRIDVDGNTQLSKFINSCFYYLMSFLPSQNVFLPNRKFYGLSPGGLANGANWTDYQGHVFWDMETWMYPGILMFHPELAREMLSYRINNMEPAYERARENGQEGLRYPWESARTGYEVTPDICVPCRENQQHVTGDIGLAARQYLSASKDTNWLKANKGFTFIRDMAKYWYTRPVYNNVTGLYDINGVMPPDEHAESVNNSVYTNVGAKLSINFARYVACLSGVNVEEEVPKVWLERAKQIALPFDEKIMFHPEYDGYRDDLDARGVKQADVILLGFPQMWPVDREVRRNDLVHYEKVTNPLGPAMTWGMFSIGWLELDEDDKAAELFKKSYSLYTREPFKIWTEARAGIGAVNFLTGMGGFLQSVLFGYGGLRLHTEQLTFNPKLPPDTSGLRFKSLDYVGNSLDIVIKPEHVSVVAKQVSSDNPLVLVVDKTGAMYKILHNKELLIPRQPFTMKILSVSDCPLPEGDSCPIIVSRRKWSAVEPKDKEMINNEVKRVIIQQTGGIECLTLDECQTRIRHIQESHQRIGVKGQVLGDIAYNFLIGSDGRVYEGRGWGLGPYHPDVEVRLNSLSIAFVGNYTCTEATDVAMMAAKQLIKCARERNILSEDYILVHESQMESISCGDVTCIGDRLFCTIKFWLHWTDSQVGNVKRVPNCHGQCDEKKSNKESIKPLYQDTNKDPTVFATDRLPMVPATNKIDYRFMASVGNGHIATVVYSDTIYMNGLYNGPSGWSHRARIPSNQAVRITLPGHTSSYYALDTKRGVFEETLVSDSGVKVVVRTYAHQYYTQLMVLEILATRISRTDDITIMLNNEYEETSIDLVETETSEYKDNYRYTHYKTKETETVEERLSNVFVFQHNVPSKLTLRSDQTSNTWIYFMSIDTDKRKAEPAFNAALQLSTDKHSLYNKHVEAWQRAWDQGRVEVGDNIHLSKLINSCFYYLLSFLPASDTFLPNEQFYGLSPGGLANGANWTDYQGHVFWDMETWMYPGILVFRPDLAKEMLSYRIYGMPEAKKRAESGGYEGVRFPWESAKTGAEQTPDICVPCRENQQHITGDIALAARQYFSLTKDFQWLKDKNGYELIRDIAKFWKSRPIYNPETGQYDINGVMPPDEHAENVNNSVYTNVGAKLSIYYANYVACLLNKTKVDNTEDWIEIADKLALPFDSKNQVHPEYDGYYDGDDERGVKQADVILLGYPQMWKIKPEVRRHDLLKYELVTNPMGPAMTWGMFSIGWLELEEEEIAASFFEKSYLAYNREPFKIWTEARAGIGAVNFLTGMGGFLQAVINGYGGLRIYPEYLYFNPRVTPDTSYLRFVGLNYLGHSLDIEIKEEYVSLVDTDYNADYPLYVYSTTTESVTKIMKNSTSCPEVISRSEWGGVELRSNKLNTPVSDVIIYQTNTPPCFNHKDCYQTVQKLEKSDMTEGKGSIGYNFIIGYNMKIFEGRGWNWIGDHSTVDRNSKSIGIAIIGNYTHVQPDQYVMSLLQSLLQCGMETNMINKDYKLIWEGQLENTDCTENCPGDQLYCYIQKKKHWQPHLIRWSYLSSSLCLYFQTRLGSNRVANCDQKIAFKPTSEPKPTVVDNGSPSFKIHSNILLSFLCVVIYNVCFIY